MTKNVLAIQPVTATIRVLTAAGALCLLLTCFGCSDDAESSGIVDRISEVTGFGQEAAHRDPDADIPKPIPSSSGPWPKAVAEERDFDFGRMRVGTTMNHEFTIANDGEAALFLVPGNATCKCTKFELSSTEVAPGESVSLFIEWEGKEDTVSFQHGGSIYTNDPERPSLRFNVQGIVDEPLSTQPAGSWDAGVIADDPVEFTGFLFSRVFPYLTIEDVSAETELTSVEFQPMSTRELAMSEARSGWKFIVTMQPGSASGIQKDTLTVVTSELEEPFRIRVHARRLGKIRFSAMRGTRFTGDNNTVMMGQFPAAKGHKAELMMVVDHQGLEEEIELTEVVADPKSLKINVETMGKPTGEIRRYRVTIEVPPGGMRLSRIQDKAATLRCVTNHPTEPEFQLNVQFKAF